MCHHDLFCVWELAGGQVSRSSGVHGALGSESCSVHFAVVLYILLIAFVVVTVCFVCCSVKLPLSQPMSFAFFFPFSSPPQWWEWQ